MPTMNDARLLGRRGLVVAACLLWPALAMLAGPAASRREHASGPVRAAGTPPSGSRSGPCPVREAAPCVIELHGPGSPSASASCTAEPWSRSLQLTLPTKWADSNKDGWWETVLRIPLDPARDCSCARFKIDFDAPGVGFHVNIGDSPTNNGYGGDAGTTHDSAETQILARRLSVFSSVPALAKGPTNLLDRLLDLDLPPLTGRTMNIEVCDQSLAVELSPGRGETKPLHWKLQTLNAGLLYALAPRHAVEGTPAAPLEDHAIYAAFNRVIHVLDGPPSNNRAGSAVRRVEIMLSP